MTRTITSPELVYKHILLQSAIRKIFSLSIFGFSYRVSRHGYFATRAWCKYSEAGGGSRDGDTGTISGEATLDTGGGIITALQGNNHQAMCLLVSCPRHHATCRLKTADSLHGLVNTADLDFRACFQKYKSEFTPKLIIICR